MIYAHVRDGNMTRTRIDLPLSGDPYLRDVVFGVAVLLVDVDLLLPASRMADSVFFVDVDLLFCSAVFAARKGRGDGSEVSFVTFPSDARSLLR